jgi:hypothetical protein
VSNLALHHTCRYKFIAYSAQQSLDLPRLGRSDTHSLSYTLSLHLPNCHRLHLHIQHSMATPPGRSTASEWSGSKPPPLPHWQRRQLQRNHYLNDCLASRMQSSPSPAPASLDLRRDVELDLDQQSDLSSTSLHLQGGTSTPQRTLSSASTFAPYYSSLQVKSVSRPDLVSQASSFKISVARTSNSWTTCSEHEPDTTFTEEAIMANKVNLSHSSAHNHY